MKNLHVDKVYAGSLQFKCIIFHELTCCFGFEDFDVGFCGLQCLGFELRLQRSPHRASADGGEANVAAGRKTLVSRMLKGKQY